MNYVFEVLCLNKELHSTICYETNLLTCIIASLKSVCCEIFVPQKKTTKMESHDLNCKGPCDSFIWTSNDIHVWTRSPHWFLEIFRLHVALYGMKKNPFSQTLMFSLTLFFLMLFHFLDAMIETNKKIFIVTILFGNKRKVSKHFTNVIRAEWGLCLQISQKFVKTIGNTNMFQNTELCSVKLDCSLKNIISRLLVTKYNRIHKCYGLKRVVLKRMLVQKQHLPKWRFTLILSEKQTKSLNKQCLFISRGLLKWRLEMLRSENTNDSFKKNACWNAQMAVFKRMLANKHNSSKGRQIYNVVFWKHKWQF